MKKILIIHKGQFDTFPPLLSAKLAMNELGYSVDVLTTKVVNTDFFKSGENCYIIGRSNKIPFFSFLLWYLKFLYIIKKLIRNNYDYIWIEGGDTLALFGKFIKVNNKRKFIVQISELYDALPIYKYFIGKSINKFDKIVMPEINRAYIYKVWFELSVLPFILPNKPYYSKYTENLSLDKHTLSVIDQVKYFARDRKIILYQGLIAKDRKFKGVVDFVIKNNNYCLVLLGKDSGYLNEINIDKYNIYHAGYLMPPFHMEITKLASICLLAYDTTSLNKVYCAPNKIWEYSKIEKPILSQYLPNIDSIFNKYGFGKCCDVNDLQSVESAIFSIESNYNNMVEQSAIFYKSLNFKEIVNEILNK